MKRKNYSKELKSRVALAAIKGNQTVNEIASEFGIHTSLVYRWKKEAIGALPLILPIFASSGQSGFLALVMFWS